MSYRISNILYGITIKAKLALLSAVLLLILVITNSTTGLSLQNLNHNVETLKENSSNVTKQANSINAVLYQQQEKLDQLNIINAALNDFHNMQFWLTDLAVSWLNESEGNAEKYKEVFLQKLDIIASSSPKEAQQIRAYTEQIFELYIEAVDSYVDENRVRGNSLLAKAKAKSTLVDDLLMPLKNHQEQAVIDAKESASTSASSTLEQAKSMETLAETTVSNGKYSIFMATIGTIIAVIFSIALTAIIIQSVISPIRNLVGVVQKLAEGDLTAEIPPESKTEIGDLVRATSVLKDNSIAAEKLREEQALQDQKLLERADKVDSLVNNFDAKTSELLDTLTAAATEMEATSATMQGLADQTSERSTSVASAAEEAGVNVEHVASAAEELATSIQHIMGSIDSSVQNTQAATESVRHTETAITELSQAAEEISQIIGLITDIAEQTNLLALNATIESARAGDAGKGFAVVANEVKALASETQKATIEISATISKIQASTKNAVSAIGEVSQTIAQVNVISNELSDSMNQQAEATQEIAKNVQEASTGTQDVTENITLVSAAAAESGHSASEVLDVAKELAKRSDEMKKEIEHFIDGIKAA
ncbi:MAG: hypothetical protein COA45_04710 [Zetaproteobacteria bacterium]|nr:MAG: hypothetical protein COA45_04710 [Zetaproteobacteria bacterium]